MNWKYVYLLAILISLLIAGCSQKEEKVSTQKEPNLTVYTTVYPLQYIVEEIGGETVAAESIYPPGADAHTYEPTAKDMTRFANSDAFIYIGAGMEGFSETISAALNNQKTKLIEIGKEESLFHKDGHLHDEHDHHVDATTAHTHEEHSESHANDHPDEKEEHMHRHEEIAHDHEHDEHEHENKNDVEQIITIEGLAAHYHTGDTIELTAHVHKDGTYDHWHWFTLEPGKDDWELVKRQESNTYSGEATIAGQKIKAVVLNNAHEVIAESNPISIAIDDHLDHDPHLWIDPFRMIEMAVIIKDELITLNPQKEQQYNENFQVLKRNLIELDNRFIQRLEAKENKHIIVPHAAFGYWEERYGIKQITINGLSSSEEPSQKELTEVMKAAKDFDLEYILYEQNSENRLSKVIQAEIGAEALMIHNLEVRTETDIKNDKDYISLMDENLEVLDQVTK
ncbi:metal ABC transporter solute-binding protein, Zn/Mn family [Virgibacillus sp. W0430]|uniref:metal ABC transporter solute-binding protein, Zn/Mn family n=1 Tax=Virgibacillus sp. W0430 TaxID=3391580 RepID=UPI003F47FF47